MNTKTKNFIDLCRGENTSSIQTALSFQSKLVLNELYELCDTTDHREISIKLSNGIQL